jgi:hypothetical protein
VPALLIVGTDLIRDMEIFDGVTSNITFRHSSKSITILLCPESISEAKELLVNT